MTPISEFFAQLGFPLHNVRWSWGAERDGAILLRTWEQDFNFRECKVMALRAAARRDVTEPDARAGRAERVQHAKALWEGRAAGYTVLVTARDPNARVREIESYREDVVWAIERLQREEDGSVVAILQRIPVPVGQLAEHARNHCTAPVGTQFPVP